MEQTLIFDAELIRRYNQSGPRYTSYPTAVQFSDRFSAEDYRHQVEQSNQANNPLSLYFHIPFCDTVCFYCACNKIATKDRSKAAPYLQHLFHEIEMQASLFNAEKKVTQLHWGGGTPTFISHEEMAALMGRTRQCFDFASDSEGEYSIEIDPREVGPDTIAFLRDLGFNRMSLGVQDFELEVQKAVNRVQSEAQTRHVMEAARASGFHSVSFDLIYGLPHQTVESFRRTLDKVLELSPDRISVFNYAHLPEVFKPQRRINIDDVPRPEEKLEILQLAIEVLTRSGYVYIGMDHFAKPDDELARAQREGTLYRNFQGYSTHADCDLIGFGITSIGMVADCYTQNYKTLDDYYARLDANQLPVYRGLVLSADDKLRREIITRLICHFSLSKADIETQFNIQFDQLFAAELTRLQALEADGLVTLSAEAIQVTPVGKLLIRNICMVFDAYLSSDDRQRYSKVI
ncbi:MAG: oxygen-independent coproporphyrinogen III oxidase [Gammaproteobacteria bacterium]